MDKRIEIKPNAPISTCRILFYNKLTTRGASIHDSGNIFLCMTENQKILLKLVLSLLSAGVRSMVVPTYTGITSDMLHLLFKLYQVLT